MKDWIVSICCQRNKHRKKIAHIRVAAKNYNSAIQAACLHVCLFGKIRIKARVAA
jgi:hypothetical protein